MKSFKQTKYQDVEPVTGGDEASGRPAKGTCKFCYSDTDDYSVASTLEVCSSSSPLRCRSCRKSSSDSESDYPLSDESGSVRRSSKGGESKRGRALPPSTEYDVKLAKAKQDCIAAQRELKRVERDVKIEALIMEQTKNIAAKRAARQARLTAVANKASVQLRDPFDDDTLFCKEVVSDSLAVITNVARVSNGLKGNLQKALKDAAKAISEVADTQLTRTATEEIKLLRNAVSQISQENHDLRQEVQNIKIELENLRVDSEFSCKATKIAMKKHMAAQLLELHLFLDNKFSMIEEQIWPAPPDTPLPDRIEAPSTPYTIPSPTLRNNGSEDSDNATVMPSTSRSCRDSTPSATVTSQLDRSTARGKQKKDKEVSSARPEEAAASVASTQSGSKKNKKKQTINPTPSQTQTAIVQEKKKPQQLANKALPKTSVVIVSITSAGIAKGITYKDVFAEAKSRMTLEEVGIEEGMRFGVTRAGARKMTISEANCDIKAEALADKMRSIVGNDYVKVYALK